MQPDIVYKYRDWHNIHHKSVLQDNILYLASPKDFNDPFDCRINANFSLLSPEEGNEYKTQLAISGFAESERRGYDFKKVLKDLDRRFEDKETFQVFADSLLFNHQNESYGIFSCSKDWDNIAMWSYYANSHKGFCIGFWAKKLMDSNLFGKIGEVVYQTYYPKIKPRVAQMDKQLMVKSFKETHTKAKVWEHEKEYRFMINKFPRVLTKEDRKVKIDNSLFAEIILGINMPNKDKQDLITICQLKGIPVFHAKKEEFMFKIKRSEVFD